MGKRPLVRHSRMPVLNDVVIWYPKCYLKGRFERHNAVIFALQRQQRTLKYKMSMLAWVSQDPCILRRLSLPVTLRQSCSTTVWHVFSASAARLHRIVIYNKSFGIKTRVYPKSLPGPPFQRTPSKAIDLGDISARAAPFQNTHCRVLNANVNRL